MPTLTDRLRSASTRSRPRPISPVALGSAVLVFVLAVAVGGQSPGRHPVSGRRIAGVMGHEGASWLERAGRERDEAPARAIRALDLRPGQVIADIGAGSGYYTVRLADAVGATGRVYATDIQPEMLAIIEGRVRDRSVRNIETVRGTETGTGLPDGALDLALMVDVYHELAQPQAFLRSLARALKPNGQLVLIEFRKEDPQVPIREDHKMSVAEARAELEAEGFRFVRVIGVLPWQHILVFSPRAAP